MALAADRVLLLTLEDGEVSKTCYTAWDYTCKNLSPQSYN